MRNKWLITIVGPTAIGKTALSIQLAQYFKTEILSADSRQFFKEMTIGTAVPSAPELLAAKHHFIQHTSITKPYNVGDFEKEAIQQLELLFKKHHIVIMVGGSGLYIDAVLKGLDYFPDIDPEIRTRLNSRIINEGIEALQYQLQALDPEYYKKVDTANPHRIIRALEICIGTGKPYSHYLNAEKKQRNFQAIKIGITADRALIYDRINNRVDQMMSEGQLEEAKLLYEYKHLNALQTVGYRELFEYLDDKLSLSQATEEIKKNTRRFAKRQLTWFRKDKEINWVEYPVQTEKVIAFIRSQLDQ